MATVALVPVRQAQFTLSKTGGKQYYKTAAVKNPDGTPYDFTGWSSFALTLQKTPESINLVTPTVALGNADGTMEFNIDPTSIGTDAMLLSSTGALVITGVHVSGDAPQLLVSGSMNIQP